MLIKVTKAKKKKNEINLKVEVGNVRHFSSGRNWISSERGSHIRIGNSRRNVTSAKSPPPLILDRYEIENRIDSHS